MKKILIILGLAVVLGVVVLNVFGAVLLGRVLEGAIGAPVSVGRLHLGFLSSNVGLYNVKIKNPQGFNEKALAEIHEISMKYDLGAFFRGKVHLTEVRLDFGDVTVEKNEGKVNLLEIGAVKGMTQKKGGAQGPEPESQPGQPESKSGKPAPKGPEIQIDEVLVNIGKGRYVDSSAQPPSVKEYDLGIHDEKFKNVTDTPTLVKDIALLILRKVGLSSLTSNFDILVKGAGGEAKSALQKLVG